ncbi:MAG: sugar ABC transporter substrate-binding protein [Ignavibacteriales bacterium]|nr:sugar ABC transporter substrate-binding protein [Ignavibacteriales bacterium]
MKNKFLNIVFILVSVAAIRCDHSTDTVTVIKFWGLGNEGEMVVPLIKEFERRNPTIKVEMQQIPWTAAHEKLLTAYAGESTPDVGQLGNTWLPEFSVLNSLEPLDPFARNSSMVDVNDIFPGVLKTNIIDSVLSGIPWYVDTRVVYYRKDILQRAGYDEFPATWSEVLKASETIQRQAKAKNKICYPFFLPTNEWVPAIALGMQFGGNFLKSKNSQGNFSGEQFTKAFTLLDEFYRKQYSPSGMQLITNLYNAFSDGLIAMYITGPWNIGEFTRRIPAHLQNEWMTAPLPTMDSLSPGTSLPLGTSLVIFKNSKHKEAAWKLIEFLTSVEQSIEFYKITGNLPPRQSAWQDSSLASNTYIKAFYRQLQRVDPLPQIPEWEQIVIRLQIYVEYIATGTMTVDQAVKQFDTEVDVMLEKRRWLVEREN